MTEKYIAFSKGQYLVDSFLLLLICLAGFSCYFTYDVPATIDIDINQNLNITVDKFMMYFYTSYSLPSAVSAVLSGAIINKLGLGRGGIILALILTFAHVILALSMYIKSGILACLGRVIHGSASEPFGVVRSAFTAKYFNSALFYGLILAFSRAGSVGGIKLTPIVLCFLNSESPSCQVENVAQPLQDTVNIIDFTNQTNNFDAESDQPDMAFTQEEILNNFDFKSALTMCFVVGIVISFLSAIIMTILNYLNKYLDRKRGLVKSIDDANDKKKGLSMSDIRGIPKSAWALIYVFTVWYSAMFPFNSMLPGYMKTYCGYSKDVAANLASIVYALSVVGSPVMGAIIDKTKHHSVWLFLSSLLMTTCFIVWGFLQPITPKGEMVKIMTMLMVVLGVAYSIIASSLMAYLADITPLKLHSTAFGLLFGIQQLGVGSASYVLGWFCKTIGYDKFLYCLAFIGILAMFGNMYLLMKDGINPLGHKLPLHEGEETRENPPIVDVTTSRCSFMEESYRASKAQKQEEEINPFIHS